MREMRSTAYKVLLFAKLCDCVTSQLLPNSTLSSP